MAATTPAIKSTVRTPSTPRFGAAYDATHVRVIRRSPRHRNNTAALTVTSTHHFEPTTPKPRKATSKISGSRASESVKTSRKMEVDAPAPRAGYDGQDGLANECSHNALSTMPQHMLPTPIKTPRKKPINQADVVAGGRILFPDRGEAAMPGFNKGRKAKKHVGFSLYNSETDSHDNDIPIYTDSKDKVPDIDMSEANPFFEPPAEVITAPEPTKERRSRKRKAGLGLDGNQEIEDAFNRDEGMVYVL